MSAREQALDGLAGPGELEIAREGGAERLDVVRADSLAVRLRKVGLSRAEPEGVAEQAARLPGQLGVLGERLVATEVDPALGGATLRTAPEAMRGGEYYELDLRPGEAELRRHRVNAEGERAPAEFTLTRDQLGRVLDVLAGEP